MGKEQLTNRDHLDHLGFLAHKVGVLGEYIVAMEADEMICDDQNEYHNVGEIIYGVSGEIQKTLEDMRKIHRAGQA